ncbi:hypothetical protein EHV15_34315 [Paenibacillus oralis]|uniref:Uncharacterized protein n=1 Tax=Paenibacillus oralis TaxID=2490856 RepID=A0A3P3TAW0_9BACL|nr:hypothetical protein [Paenibacillus oralis]RRJ54674.1 hypothetical protein EHV15_34315 [Paenibacillus oralis]
MYPRYDESTRHFVIEWYERKDKKATPIRHYFEQEPMKLQLHPKDPKKIVRAHFLGKMPRWIKAYCEQKEHRFKCEEVCIGDETGWILLGWYNFTSEFQPLVSPSLKGAILKLTEMVPEFFPELKQQLLDHSEVACRNLANYNNIFENIGVYYRPEELFGQEGCLVIDRCIFLQREKDESDDDLKARYEVEGRLDQVIRELTTPLPVPILDKNTNDTEDFEDASGMNPDSASKSAIGELSAVDDDDEPLGNLSSCDEEEGIIAKVSPEIEDEEVLGKLVPEEDVLGELKSIEDEKDDSNIGTLKTEVAIDNDHPKTDDEADLETTPASVGNTCTQSLVTTGMEEVAPADDSKKDESDLKLVILDYSDKRRGIIEGQMSIF